jgi:Domain of unknown function (DUF4157)
MSGRASLAPLETRSVEPAVQPPARASHSHREASYFDYRYSFGAVPVRENGEQERAADRAADSLTNVPTTSSLPESASEEGGRPLDPANRVFYEAKLGANLRGVRIHSDAAADAGSRALRAHAFARGRHIYFGTGNFRPETAEGSWLLAHELAHTLQSSDGAVRRKGVGDPMGSMGSAGTPRQATPTENREFVQIAIDLIRRGKDLYDPFISGIDPATHRPTYRTPAVTNEQLIRQLEGWKATVEQGLNIIQVSLSGDAVLDQDIRQNYRTAVEAAVSASAQHQNRSRHDLYDEHRARILDWAWPAATQDPQGSDLSDALTAQERSHIRVVTTAITLGSVDAFFAANATPVALPANTTLRFGGAIPPRLNAGLQNIAATIAAMATGLELNSTITLALDLGRVGGDYAAYRFTRVRHPAQGRTQPATEEILVEHLGAIGLERNRTADTKSQRDRFDRLGLTLGSGWGASPDWETNGELQSLLRGLALIPDSSLTRLSGVAINRAAASATHPTWAGEYDFGAHTITLFNSAFAPSLTRVGTPGSGFSDLASFTIRHEIGHALDQISLRTAMSTWNASVTTLNAAVATARTAANTQFADVRTGPNQFRIPPGRRAAWNAIQAPVTAARAAETGAARARDAARSLSGASLQRRQGSNVFESVQGSAAAGTNAFRVAAQQDGVRLTHYSDESWLEYFAEAHAMFISAPDDLRRLRPHVFAFMQATFP